MYTHVLNCGPSGVRSPIDANQPKRCHALSVAFSLRTLEGHFLDHKFGFVGQAAFKLETGQVGSRLQRFS